ITALTGRQAGLTGGLLVVRQPLTVLLLGYEALGCGVTQRIVLVTGNLLQRNGQVAGARMVDHEHHAKLAQALEDLLATLTDERIACLAELLQLLLQLGSQLRAIVQLDVANRHLLPELGHGSSNPRLQLGIELRAQDVRLGTAMTLQLAQLTGQLLAGLLHAIGLRAQLLLETGVEVFLLAQGMVQLVDFALQGTLTFLGSQLQARQLFLVLFAKRADAQTLLLDQLGGLQTMFLFLACRLPRSFITRLIRR